MKKIFTLLSASPFFLLFCGNIYGQQTIYSENFSYAPGGIPAGWVIDAEQPPGWSINNSQISGGTAPELYMTYGMQVGLSRLISPKIDITGHKQLAISYDQYLINYAGDAGETIGVDVTFDGGQTWQPLWERPLGVLNIPQDRFTYFVTAPENATQMQYAFRYDGNNFFINGWAVDDVKIEDVANKDLLVTNITGNTTINAGKPAMFVVEVTNGGKDVQSNYTVKLKSNDGTELASTSGEPVNFGEKSQIFLNWTPQNSDISQKSIYAVVESSDDVNPANNQSRTLSLNVLKDDIKNVQIGNGSFALQHSIPFNFFTHYSLGQTMYTSQQINNSNSKITGIQYTCQFDEDNNDIPIQVYLAETDQEDLSSDWLDPSSFTLVYNGKMNFKKGFNNLYIPLETEFNYTGKNLVVYTNKSHPQMVLWSTFISTFSESPIYSRYSDRDDEPYDAMNPPQGYPVLYTPNITLFYADGTMSVIDDSSKSASVQVYPNPVKDILNIKTEQNEKVQEIRIINAAGQLVSHKIFGNEKPEVNVKELQAGFYLIQIITSKGITAKKILVEK
ncbi:T9SS type A sorting domain-containing protein [Epilithonimonas caeni]|uniref:T9SS type A sorting domain-containing protein n=1 Tax=Epilithonimonas caeni TaxID=365343 RepID=UPI00042179F4|nr:T9SS type A sorting domain-containing protein [Epilithonimonas caeni]